MKSLPQFTLGTFRHTDEAVLGRVVEAALENGNVGFDTAPSYGSQLILGRSLLNSGASRDEYFVSDKIDAWQMQQSSMDGKTVSQFIHEVLEQNGLEYYDLLYTHWPIMEYIDNTLEHLYALREEGTIRQIGICNVNVRILDELKAKGFKPDVIQQEIHPLTTEQELTNICRERDIDLVAYTPTGRLVELIVNDKHLLGITEKYDKSITQIINHWHIQHGRKLAFMTTKPSRIDENTDIFDFELTNNEMSQIDSINQDCNMFVHSTGAPGF